MGENKIELEKYEFIDFIKKEARREAAADYLKQFDPDDDVNVGCSDGDSWCEQDKAAISG